MAEEVKAVHREPHPFIGVQHVMQFVGKPVAFVGRVDRFEDNTMYMKTNEGKSPFPLHNSFPQNCAKTLQPLIRKVWPDQNIYDNIMICLIQGMG